MAWNFIINKPSVLKDSASGKGSRTEGDVAPGGCQGCVSFVSVRVDVTLDGSDVHHQWDAVRSVRTARGPPL